jgi:zinc protease
LALMEYRRAPVLTVTALARVGEAADPPGKAGTAALVAELLRRGTVSRSAMEIAEAIDLLGGTLGTETDTDSLTVSLTLLAKDREIGLDLLADLLRRSTFPAEELERARKLELSALQSLREEPGQVADRVAAETVYQGHPYGVMPTITSLQAITREDLLTCYRQMVVPNRMTIIAVGDFKAADMLARLRRRFEDWPRGDEAVRSIPPVRASPRRTVMVDKPDATQSQVRFIRTGPPRRHPDDFAVQLADAVVGGGFSSRLVDEVRVNQSLTYGIGSDFDMQRYGGDVSVSTFTKIETTRALLNATKEVLRRATAGGLTAAELQRARGYLSGQFAIGLQTPEALADQLADIALYDLPSDYLETYLPRLRAVTLTQVNRVARQYFAPDAFSLILVAPAAKVRTQLSGLGQVETRPVESVGK